MRQGFSLAIICLLFSALLSSFPAFATERADIVAGMSTLPLLIDKISGDVVMAVVYDPANVASKADADHIKQIVDAGIDVPGGGKVTAFLVGTQELSKLSRVKIAFLTQGLDAHFPDIQISASAASILTMSTDLACVKAAVCIIGVATQPAVKIYFSKTAADSAKIEYSQSFAMLVREQ